MHVKLERMEDCLIARLVGELDHHSAEEVRNKIDDRLDAEGVVKLIMDFSHVTFMDSSGIGVVIGRFKKLSMKKGIVSVASVNAVVKRVFELSGMFKIIKAYSSVEEAIKEV